MTEQEEGMSEGMSELRKCRYPFFFSFLILPGCRRIDSRCGHGALNRAGGKWIPAIDNRKSDSEYVLTTKGLESNINVETADCPDVSYPTSTHVHVISKYILGPGIR